MTERIERRGRRPVDAITERQRRVLKVIESCIRQQGMPPTIQEIANQLSVTTTTVHAQVKQLERKGYIKRESGRARGLSVVRRAGEPVAELATVALVGSVAAGYPVLAEENIVGEILVEGDVAGKGSCFALTVNGNSMQRAKINDGDILIVRQQQLAEHGDIVVAMVDGEATVKRLHIDDHIIELRPENKKYRPIPIGSDTDLRILGKVVAVRRRPK